LTLCRHLFDALSDGDWNVSYRAPGAVKRGTKRNANRTAIIPDQPNALMNGSQIILHQLLYRTLQSSAVIFSNRVVMLACAGMNQYAVLLCWRVQA
jgi:hypothetical protein